MSDSKIPPKVIRLRDAPAYLGMDKNRFNREVRPTLAVIPIGIQGIGFERLDLDAWMEDYKQRSGRPAVNYSRSKALWDAKSRQGYANVATSGISKNKSLDSAFEKALALSYSAKPKTISHKANRRIKTG